jgi:hypothetical protein
MLRQSDDRDDVYQLQVSLIPVTRLPCQEDTYGSAGDTLANHQQEP